MTTSRLMQTAGLMGVCLIVLLSLVPGSSRPHTGMAGDLEHLFAYGLTAAVLALGWRSPMHVVGIILGLLALASMLELAQLFVPGRGASGMTAVVSGLGGACGALLAARLFQTLDRPLRLASHGHPHRPATHAADRGSA